MRELETLADVKGTRVREWNRPYEEDMDAVPRPLRLFTYIFTDGYRLDKKMIRALAPILSEKLFKCPIDYLWMMSDWEDYAKLYPPESKQVPPPPPPYESNGYPGWELYAGAESFNDVLERFKGTRLMKMNPTGATAGQMCRWWEIKVTHSEPEDEESCGKPDEEGW